MSARSVLVIDALWNGRPVASEEAASVEIRAVGDGWRVLVDAPFFGDPAPPGAAASTEGLWGFEVVELFVADRASLATEPRYTELELSPHGHFLVLRFAGVRRRVAIIEPRDVEVRIAGVRWRGSVLLARTDLPSPPWNANAFAAHGVGARRRFLAAAAVPGEAPDFHQPEAFPQLPAPVD